MQLYKDGTKPDTENHPVLKRRSTLAGNKAVHSLLFFCDTIFTSTAFCLVLYMQCLSERYESNDNQKLLIQLEGCV